MTPEKRKTAIKWLQEEIRSLRLAPKINGCGPENWADLLEIMETCLEAVRWHGTEPLTIEQLRKMDGQPVWVHVIDHTVFSDKEDDFDGWGMCRKSWVRIWDNKRADLVHIDYDFEDYGKEWIAYASPTAHIDREAWTAQWVEDGQCDHKPYRVRDAEKWKKYKCSKCEYKAGRRTSQKYCPSCGKAMTPDAWAELEKRLMG